MASILPNGKTQFIDVNGRPLVRGKVYYYEPNTETFKDTYTDSSATTPNENPVTLDGAGRATIWGVGSYRQVVYDWKMNLLWDEIVSEIGADLDQLKSDLAGAGGAQLVGFQQSGAGTVVRTVQDKDRERLTDADFGVPTNGIDDATAHLRDALTEWKVSGRPLVLGPGRFKITAPIVIDLDGYGVSEIHMIGSIVPNAGIGRAITIKNARGGKFVLKVFGGGQTADYTQANPTGGDEAFVFVNCYGGEIEVGGSSYAGRVLRVTSDTPGSGGFQTQWMDIRSVYVNSSSPITADETTRLANGVGQAFYIDSGTNAFGRIRHAFMAWEKYGSVIENTSDVTFDDAETIYRGNTGMQLRGVISFWGGTLKLGSEKDGWTSDLLNIGDSATRNSQNVNIKTLFCVGGYNGLVATNIGVTAGQGLSVGTLDTRSNVNRGVILNNCRKINIADGEAYADGVSLHLTGAFNLGEINIDSIQSKLQAIIIDSSVTGQVVFGGSATNGNNSKAANISLIDIGSTAPFIFDNFIASSGDVDYLYDPPVGNTTRIVFGQVVAVGGTAIFSNQPNRATGVIGWQTSNKGTAVIAAGTTSIPVNHGIVKAPDYIALTSRDAGGVGVYAPLADRTTTQFTIRIASAPASNVTIDWRAEANYSG